MVDGELEIELDGSPRRLSTGESVYIPRKVEHVWAAGGDNPAKIIDVYRPAGKIEDFFRHVGSYSREQPIHAVMQFGQFHRLFEEHGMELTGQARTNSSAFICNRSQGIHPSDIHRHILSMEARAERLYTTPS